MRCWLCFSCPQPSGSQAQLGCSPSVPQLAQGKQTLWLRPCWERQGKPPWGRKAGSAPGLSTKPPAHMGKPPAREAPAASGVPCPNTLAPSEPHALTRWLQVSPGLPEPALPCWQGALTCQGSYLSHDERRHTLCYKKPPHISSTLRRRSLRASLHRPHPGAR